LDFAIAYQKSSLPIPLSPFPVPITKKNIKLVKAQAIDSSEQHTRFSPKNPIFAVFGFNLPSNYKITRQSIHEYF
jgi:hypothetical protein